MDFLGSLGVGGSLLLGLQLASFRGFLLEAVYPAFRIDEFLTAGEERVTAGTDFDTQIAFMRGTSVKCVTTRADYIHFFVGGVYPGFHDLRNPFTLNADAHTARRQVGEVSS